MELVCGFILVLVISYYIQKLCIKAEKKILKVVPVICVVVFAVTFAIELDRSIHGGDFFWFHVAGMSDILALVVLYVFCIVLLAGAALGVAIAWITHIIAYMVRKRKEKQVE